MAFRCPYCQFRITVKTPPKPGRYTPKCPKCSGKIALTVTDDTNAEWDAAPIPGENPAIPAAPEATVAPEPPPKAAPKKEPARVEEATIASSPAIAPSAPDQTEVTGGFFPSPVGEHTEAIPRQDGDATGVFSNKEPEEEERTGVFEPPTRANFDSEATVAGDTNAGPAPAADKKKKKASVKAPSEDDIDMPEQLGGYEIVKELGRGGMGAVYLGRQVSLDRPVALKVMNTRWASDPVFLARFTREAYAAAQLVHHNVVQIYDIGEQQGINFFSMEFVEGKSLGDVLKKGGKMTIEAAIGYIVQAARGLKFAHERGMVHRDVKPDNLMLNVHGIVKVADLGLVKTPAMSAADDAIPKTEADPVTDMKSMSGLRSLPSDITMVNSAMGSPSYMSPEQCRDASHVDPRADVYSLGCTLYAMLSGKPPFSGNTVFELMTKHATEPAKPLTDIPPDLNAVVMKSLAKEPESRHQTMDEFIGDLERFLPGQGGAFKPSEEHLATLEVCVQRFQASPAGKLRKKLIPAFFVGASLATVVGFLVGGSLVGFTLLGVALLTLPAYFMIDGLFNNSYIFRKAREWFFGARFSDWAMGTLGLILFVVVLVLVGLHWIALISATLSVAIAFVLGFLIDRKMKAQRAASLEDTQKLLKRFRVAGMDEDTLRLFVAQNAGQGWEEFFEALFGFEAKMTLRPKVHELAGDRKPPRFAAWREPLLARFERAQEARREAKARKHLKAVEVKKLQAEGIDKKAAEEQAEAAAEHMVEQAVQIKAAKERPINVRKAMQSAEKPAKKLPKPPGYRLKKLLGFVFGWKLRFAIAALLIVVGALWVRDSLSANNALKALESAKQVGSSNTSEGAQAAAKQAASSLQVLIEKRSMEKFQDFLFWVNSLNPLIAGLILLPTVLAHRGMAIMLSFLGAVIALVPHQLDVIPTLGPVEPHQLTMVVGIVLGLVGFVLGRRRD